MTARVLDVMQASSAAGVRHQERSSMSANTGVAPTYVIGAEVAIQVASGTITSSPGPIPRPASARWMAEVAEGSAIAWRRDT